MSTHVRAGAADGPPPPLARLLGLALQELQTDLQERLTSAGFTDQRLAHHAVFAHVPPEGITLAELARRAGMTKQAMSELVRDLEQKDYLRRRPDPEDRRAKVIELTDRGWEAVDAALQAFGAIERDLKSRLGSAEVDQLRRTLERMQP